jgi:hypothetical protein
LKPGYVRSQWLGPLLLAVVIGVAAGLRLYRLDGLPPGLYQDEAYNGLDAMALAQGLPFPRLHEQWERVAFADEVAALPQRRFPVFLVGNYGREPLFHYLLALSVTMVGARPLAIRLVPAIVGILMVPSVFWLGWELALGLEGSGRRRALRVGVWSAACAAVWYWLVHFSRFGIRPILLPWAASLAFAALSRGVRTGQKWMWAVGGFWMGLCAYTFASARMLPLVAGGWFLFAAWGQPGLIRRRWREWVLALAVAVIVFAPLGLFFLRHPEWFWLRSRYVVSDNLETESLGERYVNNVGRVVKGFFVHGEENLRHNLPGRPMLDPVQALWFVMGLVGVGARLGRRVAGVLPGRGTGGREGVVTDGLLLLWLVVMLLPTYLTSDAPHFGRAIGITPAVVVLMALGMDAVWRWGRRQTALFTAVSVTLAASVAYTGLCTGRDYFVRWAAYPGLDQAFRVPLVRIGQYVRDLDPEEWVYMTPPTVEYAPILFTLGGEANNRIQSFTGSAGATPGGREGQPVTYVIRAGDEGSLSLLARRLPQGAAADPSPYFDVYHLPADGERVAPVHSLAASWPGIDLVGFDLGMGSYSLGEDIPLTVYWRATAPIERRYTFFVHLVGPPNPATGNALWAQHDAQPGDGTYPTLGWRVNEIVIDAYPIQIPANAPAGEYALVAGFYYLPTLERLPVVDGSGLVAGDAVTLETLRIAE